MSNKHITSAKFDPINKAHAILEAVFFCEFQTELDDHAIATLIAKLRINTHLQEFFDTIKPIEEIAATVKQGEPLHISQPRQVGLEMISASKDDEKRAEWILRITSINIAIHCLDYSRWQPVWNKSQEFISIVFENLEIDQNPFSSLGMRFVDRFVFSGTTDQYDASLLFRKPNSRLIAVHFFESGPRWHCHNGWFENIDENHECLNQLNIDCGFSRFQNSEKHLTTIEHNLVIRDLDDAIDDPLKLLDNLMGKLHITNKRILCSLITPAIAESLCLVE